MAGGHFGEFVFLDYSEKASTMRFYFGAITAVSIGGFLTQFGALRTALGGITLGTIQKEKWVGDETILDNAPPTNPAAQREIAFRIFYEVVDGGRLYHMTLACADASKVIPGTDIVDLTDTDIQAFVTALESIAVPPFDDEAWINVMDIRLVGQNR